MKPLKYNFLGYIPYQKKYKCIDKNTVLANLERAEISKLHSRMMAQRLQ